MPFRPEIRINYAAIWSPNSRWCFRIFKSLTTRKNRTIKCFGLSLKSWKKGIIWNMSLSGPPPGVDWIITADRVFPQEAIPPKCLRGMQPCTSQASLGKAETLKLLGRNPYKPQREKSALSPKETNSSEMRRVASVPYLILPLISLMKRVNPEIRTFNLCRLCPVTTTTTRRMCNRRELPYKRPSVSKIRRKSS